jgi:hypothetical protein
MADAVRWFTFEEMGSTTICTVGWGSDNAHFWRQLFGTAREQLYARVPDITAFNNANRPRVQADWLMRARAGMLAGQWVAVSQQQYNQPLSGDYDYSAPVRLGFSNVTRAAPNG